MGDISVIRSFLKERGCPICLIRVIRSLRSIERFWALISMMHVVKIFNIVLNCVNGLSGWAKCRNFALVKQVIAPFAR